MSQLRARMDAVVTVDGVPTSVREGQAFDADSATVREFPWLFESPVEQATAAPGERRRSTRK